MIFYFEGQDTKTWRIQCWLPSTDLKTNPLQLFVRHFSFHRMPQRKSRDDGLVFHNQISDPAFGQRMQRLSLCCQPVHFVSSGDSGSDGSVSARRGLPSTALTTCQCYGQHRRHWGIITIWLEGYIDVLDTLTHWSSRPPPLGEQQEEGSGGNVSLAAVTVHPSWPPALWWHLAWLPLTTLQHSLCWRAHIPIQRRPSSSLHFLTRVPQRVIISWHRDTQHGVLFYQNTAGEPLFPLINFMINTQDCDIY